MKKYGCIRYINSIIFTMTVIILCIYRYMLIHEEPEKFNKLNREKEEEFL